MSARAAAVAGLFYESDPAQLQQHIDELLARAPAPCAQAPQCLVVPHAGYIYSGYTAATAYKQLLSRRASITRVVLLGPAHRVYLEGMAIPSVDTFSTPLGEIALDRSGLAAVEQLSGVVVSDEAHDEEHSLEVQLPFLQRVLDNFTLLPVVVGQCPAETVATLIDQVSSDPGTLVIISTDLSHFHPYAEAQLLDHRTCERILSRDTQLGGEDACGARALNGLLASQFCDNLQITLLHQCNSGDTAGDHSRVVGYGAFALH